MFEGVDGKEVEASVSIGCCGPSCLLGLLGYWERGVSG